MCITYVEPAAPLSPVMLFAAKLLESQITPKTPNHVTIQGVGFGLDSLVIL